MRNKASRLVDINTDAFTLIEVLMAMALVGIVTGAIYGIFISSNRSYHTQHSVADAQQRVRAGIDFMLRDIRVAGLDPLGSADARIEVATTQMVQFTADIDLDGVIDDPDSSDGLDESDLERIAYEYDGNNLLQRVLYKADGSEEDRQTLIDNVNALTFNYLDANGSATATLAEIRTVEISMSVRGTDARGQTFTRSLNTRVSCRNLSVAGG